MKTLWFNWSRGFGKTSRLAEICRRDKNAVFVTYSRSEAQRVSKDFNLPRDQVIAVHDLREGLQKRCHGETFLVVDNMDLMFNMLFGCHVGAFSTNRESIVVRREPDIHPCEEVS